MTTHTTRRYDLDWLRIGAFGLLIFYHIGMFYVPWEFHVKSFHLVPEITPLMKLINPWRMALLFIISGVALRYAMDKSVLGAFVWRRFWQLYIPLNFGMFVIVVPQAWLEMLEKGEFAGGILAFYPHYITAWGDHFSIMLPTWNHLWYVVYLLLYSLLLAPIHLMISRTGGRFALSDRVAPALKWLSASLLLLVPVILFGMYRHWLTDLFPSTHALVDDWANHSLYFPLFLFAFLLAKNEMVWRQIHLWFLPSAVIVLALIGWQIFAWSRPAEIAHAMSQSSIWKSIRIIATSAYPWACLVLLFGMAARWANHPSKSLRYMTEAIFPWYILHQTIIVMAGYWLTRQSMPLALEAFCVLLATIGGCFLAHEYVIRRITILRRLFGLKAKPVGHSIALDPNQIKA